MLQYATGTRGVENCSQDVVSMIWFNVLKLTWLVLQKTRSEQVQKFWELLRMKSAAAPEN